MASNETASDHSLDDIIVGTTYVLVSAVSIVIYIPCLIVMHKDGDLKKHSCFRMMFHLGISDLVNLTDQLVAGYMTMTGLARKIPTWFNQIFGGTHSAFTWYPYTTLCNIIALNRYLTICFPHSSLADRIFSPKATVICIASVWLYALCWWLVYMSPYGGFIFFADNYAFYFDPTAPWFNILKDLAWYQTIFNFVLTTIWYLGIVIHIRATRHTMVAHISSMEKKERKIMVQACIICLYTIVCDQYWHLQPMLLEKYGMKYTYAIGNLLWISESAMNPIVYYTLNKTIREKVKAMFCAKATVHPTGVQMVNQRHTTNQNRSVQNRKVQESKF